MGVAKTMALISLAVTANENENFVKYGERKCFVQLLHI